RSTVRAAGDGLCVSPATLAARKLTRIQATACVESTPRSWIIGRGCGPLAQWIEHAPSKRGMWVRFPHGLQKPGSIQVSERSDLAAVVKIVLDHRPEDPPARPLLAPVREDFTIEPRIIEIQKVVLQQRVALLELRDRILRRVRGVDIGERQLRQIGR